MIKENELGEVVINKEMFFGMVGELEWLRKELFETGSTNKLLMNENDRLIKLIESLTGNK